MVRQAAAGWKLSASSNFNNELPPSTPRLALTIPEFCAAHRISEGFYYKLKKQHEGPREMRLGTRKVISLEAAAEWRREREAAGATAEAEAKAVARSSPMPPAPPMKHGAKTRPLVRRRSVKIERANAE
jgi:hypothetical protein